MTDMEMIFVLGLVSFAWKVISDICWELKIARQTKEWKERIK